MVATHGAMVYFIIIYPSDSDDLLYINRISDKEKKQGYVLSLYAIVSLNFKNNKRPIKPLNIDVQVK